MEHLSTICFIDKIVWSVMVSESGCKKSMENDGKTNPDKHWRVCLEKRSSACIHLFHGSNVDSRDVLRAKK